MAKYLSKRQPNLNLGISSYTESNTVLQTIGKVGIGTTNAGSYSLYVVGTTNITGDINVGGASTFVGVGTFGNDLYVANQLYVGGVNVSGGSSIGEDITTRNFLATGISTFNGFVDANGGLDVTGHTELDNVNVSGVATIASLAVQSNFNVYDTQAVFHNDLFIAGNLSIGGTTTVLISEDLFIIDKTIVLGIATDSLNVDIANDDSANGGGISIASTEGNPLVSLQAVGVNSLPNTHKKILWSKANTYGIGTTDAWMFNYAVGIGSTLVPNGVRFAVSEIQFTDDTINTPNINVAQNLNISGTSTLGIASASQLYVSGLSTFAGITTVTGSTLFAKQLNVSGISTFVGITTNQSTIFGTQLSVSGVSTFFGTIDANGDLDVDGHTELDNVNISGITTFAGAIDADGDLDVDGHTELDNVNISGITTFAGAIDANGDLDVDGHTELDNVNISGITTFVGVIDANGDLDVDGHTELDNVNIGEKLNVVGFATFAGITTVTGATLFAKQLSVSGVITATTFIGALEGNAGTATTTTNIPNLTGDITSVNTATTLATVNSNVGTFGSQTLIPIVTVNAKGLVTAVSTAVVGTALTIAGDSGTVDIDLLSETLTISGGTNLTSVGSGNSITVNLDDSISLTNINVTGLATFAGITTVTGPTLFTKQLNVSGITTTNSLSIDATQVLSSARQLQNIASLDATTTATIESAIQLAPNDFNSLNISGLSTFAGITTVTGSTLFAKQLNVSGVSTLAVLHTPSLTNDGSDFGSSGYFPKANGSGGWSWAAVPGLFSVNNILNGFNVSEENSIVGTAGSITQLDFRGNNIIVTADSAPNGIATVRVSDTPSFTTLNVTGLSTFAGITTVTGSTLFTNQLSVSGVSTFVGVTTNQSTIFGTQLSVSGVSTFTGAIDANGDLDVDGHTELDNVNISGITTFAGAIDADGDLDVDGHTELDNVNISGITTFAGAIDANGDLDVDGHTELDNVNISGITTFAGAIDADGDLDVDGHTELDNVNVSGIITATAFHTGAEGSAIRITSNTISGPANLIIDPAAVGDDTGAVRIKGDLFVDGTQFVVNSTTIELADFNVGIATTVGTNLILDGAGIGIGSANIRKTFVYDDASNTLQSSIGLGVTVGGDFKTGTDSVLNKTTLGPTVVNSSLTSVGTLSSLNVSGLSTFAGITTVTGSTLFTNQLSVSGFSTFVGVGTFQSDLYVGGNLFVQNDLVFDEFTARNINVTGIGTIAASSLGFANASTLNVTGLSTFAGITTVTGSTLFTNQLSVSGISTFTGAIDANGDLDVDGHTELDNVNISGITTFVGAIDANGDLDVDGHTELDNVNISGITTFAGAIDANGDLDVDGYTELDDVNISGTLNVVGLSTFAGITTVTGPTLFTNQLSVSGVSTFNGIVQVGAAITLYPATGIISATSFYGDGASLTNTGSTLSAASGTQRVVLTSLTSGTMVTSSTDGDLTFDATTNTLSVIAISASNATFSGNVSIAGTLTYEDVTNIDSIGVVTARSSVVVGAGLSVVGFTTLASAGGITTTGGDLYVEDDIFFKGNLYKNGVLFTAGVGIGSTTVNPGSGVINQRIGVGFTDINFVGTGLSVTGYGSTVVIDFGNIAAASGGALSISTVFSPRIQDISFVGGASTSIIGISTQTDRFIFDTQTGSVGIGTTGSSIPSYKLDVIGDINSSTSVKIKGVDVLEEAVRLAIAFG
jgi:hypothetical protein